MTLTTCLAGTLAVWRVTHLLAAEDGPWELSLKLRQAAAGGFFGRLLDCFYCLSLWVAAAIGLALGGIHPVMWLALSGGAILLERATAGPIDQPAYWHEDTGEK